ncbi:MAG: glycerol-3-phosphate 1-O-acyltransferase PlsY, partial [Pseudomonadota bacterium]
PGQRGQKHAFRWPARARQSNPDLARALGMIAVLQDTAALQPLLAALLGYLLGSIPFGLVFGYLSGQGDIRKIGSGNIGATNALRTGKKWVALLTLIGDAGKGAVAVWLARTTLASNAAIDPGLAAGIAAFIGHLYPVWLGFKGGKGVATFIGTLLAITWPIGLAACGVWLLTLALFRYSSLASLNSAFMSPILAVGIEETRLGLAIAIMTVLIFLKHSANISRLRKGTEPKVGRKP